MSYKYRGGVGGGYTGCSGDGIKKDREEEMTSFQAIVAAATWQNWDSCSFSTDTSCNLPSAAETSLPANNIAAPSPAATINEFMPAVNIFSSTPVLTDPAPHDFHPDFSLTALPSVQ